MTWRKRNGQCITVRSEEFKRTNKSLNWLLYNFQTIILFQSFRNDFVSHFMFSKFGKFVRSSRIELLSFYVN